MLVDARYPSNTDAESLSQRPESLRHVLVMREHIAHTFAERFSNRRDTTLT